METFQSPAELWTHFLQPGAIIHNPYEDITLRLSKGFPERLSRIKKDTWVATTPPVYYKCWQPL